jgi:hypothetical protein
MFDKIGRYAESVATSAGQSRRGFLGRLGQAALGAAGVAGGLLLFSGQAQACVGSGCDFCCPDGTIVHKDCPCGCHTLPCTVEKKGMKCGICGRDCKGC